jgi:hypothetical protein
MAMTPKEASDLIELQNEINSLYEKMDSKLEKLVEKYGAGVHVLEHDSKEHPWIKVSLIDNVARLKEGKIFKATAINKYALETRPLKRKPSGIEVED